MAKSHASINRWIREQEVRLGIGTGENPPVKPQPTVTVYSSPYLIERLAHAGADLLIANNAGYDLMCARLDAELAETIEGSKFNLPPLPILKVYRKSGRATDGDAPPCRRT